MVASLCQRAIVVVMEARCTRCANFFCGSFPEVCVSVFRFTEERLEVCADRTFTDAFVVAVDCGILNDDNRLVVFLWPADRLGTRFHRWVETLTMCFLVASPALVAPCIGGEDVRVNVPWGSHFAANGVTRLVGRFPIPNVSWSRLDKGVDDFGALCSPGTLIHGVRQGARAYLFGGRALCLIRDPNVRKNQPSGEVIQ